MISTCDGTRAPWIGQDTLRADAANENRNGENVWNFGERAKTITHRSRHVNGPSTRSHPSLTRTLTHTHTHTHASQTAKDNTHKRRKRCGGKSRASAQQTRYHAPHPDHKDSNHKGCCVWAAVAPLLLRSAGGGAFATRLSQSRGHAPLLAELDSERIIFGGKSAINFGPIRTARRRVPDIQGHCAARLLAACSLGISLGAERAWPGKTSRLRKHSTNVIRDVMLSGKLGPHRANFC